MEQGIYLYASVLRMLLYTNSSQSYYTMQMRLKLYCNAANVIVNVCLSFLSLDLLQELEAAAK